MTDEYTNLDLDTAEALLITAGRPELAQALRYQAQGVRNLVQGEWGTSFVSALENIMDTRVVSVLASVQQRLDQQVELVQQLIAMVRDANTTAHEALSVSKAGTARLGKITRRVDAHGDQLGEIMARLDTKRERLDGHDNQLVAHDERLSALERDNARLAALEAAVKRLAAGHGDDA